MKTIQNLILFLSASCLTIFGQTLDFDGALAKLPSVQKKVMQADTQCKVSNTHSYRLEKGCMLSAKVKLEPKTLYEISYFVKGKDLADGGKGGRIMLNNGKYWARIISTGKPESGTFDWRKGKDVIDTTKFTAPETTIILSCGETGTIWYDRIELKKLGTSAGKEISYKVQLFPCMFQDNRTTVCENQIALMEVVCSSKVDQNGKTAVITLDIPDFMNYAGFAERFPPTVAGRQKCPFTVKNIQRDGKPYKHVEITPNRYFLVWFPHSWNWHALALEPVENSVGKSGKVYWSVKIGDEVQPEQSFEITVLKKAVMTAPPCRKFAFWIPYINGLRLPLDTRLGRETAAFWESLSVRRFRHKDNVREKEFVKGKYVGYTEGMNFWDFLFTDAGYKEAAKNWPRDVDDKGRIRNEYAISSWFQLDDPAWEKAVRKAVRKMRQQNPQVKYVWSDFEPHPYGYDEGGRKRFAKVMKLDHTPTVDEVNRKYSRQWFQYMVDLHAQVIAKHAKIAHEEFTGADFWLCSDNLTAAEPHFALWCGVDVQRSDKDVDIHNHMPYYAGIRYFDDMAYMMKKITKPYLPLIDPAERILDFFQRYTPDKVKQNIVATAANGGVGIGFWPDDILSGAYLLAIADGFSMVSRAEKYYYEGKRCDGDFEVTVKNAVSHRLPDDKVLSFPDFSRVLRWTAHEKDGKFVATVFNYDEKQAVIVEIRHKKGKYAPVLVKVKPNDCALIGKDFMVPQEPLKKEIASFSGDASMFKDYTQGKATTRWASDTAGRPVILLSQGGLAAGIDVCGKCEAVSLLTVEKAELLNDGFAGKLMIDGDPLQPPLVFRYKGHGIAEGIPYVDAEAVIAPYGGANPIPNPLFRLKIARRFEVRNGKLVITHTFTNPTDKAMHFKGRLNNFPWPGYRFQSENVIMNGKYDVSAPAELRLTGKDWDGGTVTLMTGEGGLREGMTFTPDKGFCGIFSWTMKGKYPRKTVEFMIDQTLAPGKSLTLRYGIRSVR